MEVIKRVLSRHKTAVIVAFASLPVVLLLASMFMEMQERIRLLQKANIQLDQENQTLWEHGVTREPVMGNPFEVPQRKGQTIFPLPMYVFPRHIINPNPCQAEEVDQKECEEYTREVRRRNSL